MSGDAPFLERLAQLPPVTAESVVELISGLMAPEQDPLIGPLFSVDEDGTVAVNALVPVVLEHFQTKADLTCYSALIEGLTGIWNAAVRTAAVTRLRAAGLPPDDFLLRLQKLSPTLGLASERPEFKQQWLSDPFVQDAMLVQQCLVRVLFALRGMAEARAMQLIGDEA